MTEDQGPGGYIRLRVCLDRDGSEGPEDEWLWAEPLGSGRFRLESTPFYAYGLSHGDLVRAGEDREGAMPRLAEVERKSGHRTLRVALDSDWDLEQPEVQQLLDGLLGIGCSYEAMPPKLVALDVPPDTDVGSVVERLQGRSGDGMLVWEWADPRPS
jgi:hypothetical protein